MKTCKHINGVTSYDSDTYYYCNDCGREDITIEELGGRVELTEEDIRAHWKENSQITLKQMNKISRRVNICNLHKELKQLEDIYQVDNFTELNRQQADEVISKLKQL